MPANRLGTVTLAILGVITLAFALWYFLLRDDAPPPVNLDDAVASIATATSTPTPTATPEVATDPATSTASPAPTTDATVVPSDTTTADDDLSGTWTVSSVGDSFAGYRVGEELSSVGTQTAVGRTNDVSGTLEFDGATITAVEIEVDVTTLTSDDSRRDRQLRQRGLQTNAYPTSTFSLTLPIEVSPVPAEGEPFEAAVSGELTLHGVTQPISLQLTGQLVDGLVVVVGSTELQFADYEIEPPTGFIVLSVEDHGTLEFQLIFERASDLSMSAGRA